ncbi:LuxR family transcriptional regulator [Nocardioides abyssi]|uniref:LuxR family transcriptional regulator n=1 Tax=Nocardioides abyssi TaxID=3058370 RepID=A0ABT8EV45_9ACTN|nr:LuxR family transcriptional regulator [Nocardioides abyssi]MDN4162045.1 LuxR family transcriptional regulator [Nocardioides abyssi]
MDTTSLDTLADEHLAKAREHSAGRSAHTVYGGQGHALRQTLIALVAGRRLGEHENPGEATLYVVRGRVALHAGEETWEGSAGTHVVIPQQHSGARR